MILCDLQICVYFIRAYSLEELTDRKFGGDPRSSVTLVPLKGGRPRDDLYNDASLNRRASREEIDKVGLGDYSTSIAARSLHLVFPAFVRFSRNLSGYNLQPLIFFDLLYL